MFGDDLLSRGVTTRVPSALRGFTSVFGMGTGVSLSLSSPYFNQSLHSKEYSRSSLRPISIPQLHVLLHFHMEPINHIFFMGSSKKSHLEGGFVLRCLQHLSLPDVALEPCIWRYNSSTSGPSIPVVDDELLFRSAAGCFVVAEETAFFLVAADEIDAPWRPERWLTHERRSFFSFRRLWK